MSVAESSVYMTPLPRPPANVVLDKIALDTVRKNPHLFNITTPINPNQVFVESVSSCNKPNTPIILDRTHILHDPQHFSFACEQRDKEIVERHFSPTFCSLLPGMQCVPVVVVLKPHSNKFCLAVDHSAEPFALNSLIDRRDVKVKLDNLHNVGAALIFFKSNVSAAYLVSFGDGYNVDHLFGSFMALVLWIAIYVKFIKGLFTWVDDTLAYYAPYADFYPAQQTRLLEFWDEIDLPHDKPKQEWGLELLILGFDVDPNAMTMTMPAIQNLLLLGILLWFVEKLDVSDGVRMLDNEEWGLEEAELVIYCDACPTGMGYWFCCDSRLLGYQCAVPRPDDTEKPIFYYKAPMVVSSILHAIELSTVHHVFVFTDNTNMVDMFHALKAKQLYSPLLLTAIDHSICSNLQFRIVHIPGDENDIADVLSRFDYAHILQLVPSMEIYNFTPPQLVWSREHLLHKQNIALGNILEPSSLSLYTSAVQSYVTFCCTHDFSIDPTTDTLSFYIIYIHHFIKPKSVSSYLSGICNQLEVFYPNIYRNCAYPIDFWKVIMRLSFIVNDGQIKFNLPMRKADYTFEVYHIIIKATPDSDDPVTIIAVFQLTTFMSML
ncbi:hypothetical protein F5876DRAFT_91577 [Lentinula aff. lateritia]|uniref:Uncharacterized protein n=1 Tax=Lentinula aff. lateritia TaxID=2804960 RepID=A0ACC1TKW8_9AGAR|nr:hypothetical protein F5876DRAFT_91577 [Lentinula aff. lateritia]